ncbi:hypothetical protein [Polaribacter dokdonensis]|uniref:Capsule polysaccharide biosynthesis domain protein n=1 Tax=Polaribacter dokdonensis DSW-5 TaxID=1300348 RepID=A0A0M9CE25_9FLAO|nr:hypothetical protein [Polaribacter dokdonensis]KOY50662.1 Capsule polysaccharide biosynthesis domain protein [Polaribacter dokdonensis DSW-5]SEE62403.1 hypothetical protein SAMN05444353_2790 [Polaribacter dokdonensis DSW-5]
MIKGKRILLICKESFSFPMYFFAKKKIESNNQVGAFFIHPLESYYNKSRYNENTYYKFKEELPTVKLYGLSDFCKEYNEKNNRDNYDAEYLDLIEKKYTHFKNLNLQVTSSQLLSRHFHTRDFFKQSSYNQCLNFIELSYKKIEQVLEDFKPDLILDIEDGEFLRTALNEVAYKKNIPYINIDYPRFENYKIPTYTLGLGVSEIFYKNYSLKFSLPKKDLKEEIEYIIDFKNKSKIMSNEFKGTITSQYKPSNFIFVSKFLMGKLIYFYDVYIRNRNLELTQKNNILYANPIKHFCYYINVEIKKQFLLRPNRYFETPIKDEVYVYMPLHLIPESTTFVKAPFYINELNIIEQVSKSLPLNWKLYVKEHQAMLGEREYSFYKKVKKIPNVRLVQINHYQDPKPWIENAKGVITITGTAAFECALLGRKSIIFGDVPFKLIDGITRIKSFEELPELLISFGTIDNEKSCAAYLATVKEVGTKINHKYLISEGERILKGESIINDSYKQEIIALESFFDKAYTALD